MRATIKVAGLTVLAATAAMSLAASSAHAEGKLRIAEKVLGEGEVAETAGTGGSSSIEVPGLKLTVSCTSSKIAGSFGNLPHLHGLILRLLDGCTVGGALCTVYPSEEDLVNETNAGRIHLHALELWLVRRGGRDIYRVTPILPDGRHETVYMGGAKCTLAEENEVTGVTVLAVPEATKELTEHELVDVSAKEEEELVAEGMKDIGLLFGGEPMTSEDGTMKQSLVGKFEGKTFSDD